MDLTSGKQTYKQLGAKFGCSTKTIQRKLDSVVLKQQKSFDPIANVLMDTTYFGRVFGVMVFKNSLTKEVLLKYYVKAETNRQYYKGIEEIARRGLKFNPLFAMEGKVYFNSLVTFLFRCASFIKCK